MQEQNKIVTYFPRANSWYLCARLVSLYPMQNTIIWITKVLGFSNIFTKLLCRRLTLFEKSNFCPKIQFCQIPNIFTSFSSKNFLTIFLVKSKLSTGKKSQTAAFSRVFTLNNSTIFLGKSKLNFWTKNGYFEQCASFLKASNGKNIYNFSGRRRKWEFTTFVGEPVIVAENSPLTWIIFKGKWVGAAVVEAVLSIWNDVWDKIEVSRF